MNVFKFIFSTFIISMVTWLRGIVNCWKSSGRRQCMVTADGANNLPRLHNATGCQTNRLNNRPHRVNKHSTGCPTGCSTGLTISCSM